jgi:NhaP-type Na+/H+ or K+/H+ antiporter
MSRFFQVHIAGESIMNDGSAAVFYQIFSARFFYEMGLEGFGEDVGWGAGFEKFFRLAFGGTCIGVAFGLGLLVVLFSLNRRLSGGDSVVQVVATIATAYLSFFTSEVLANCSGIIAVFACGVTTKAFGETLYNDTHLFHQFREITEFLLNSLLFTLIGCVWAFVVVHEADVKSNEFSGWTHFVSGLPSILILQHPISQNPTCFILSQGYLIVLFILLNIIRFFLLYASYPLISKIEIGTNWQEAFFMSYGGLRGPVAISLALTLYAEVGK